MSKIGFIGVGKLGEACAAVMAEKHDVIGYDISLRKPKNFKMVNEISDAVVGREIIFIAVETPHEKNYDGSQPTSHLPNKDFNYTIVSNVLSKIDNYLSNNQLVVLISTVLPSTCRQILAPKISKAKFIYNPYLIAMGTTAWDMVNPEMVMIGTHDGSYNNEAADLIKFYKTLIQNDPRYVVGTWEECECIKVFYNTFISTKVSLVNMIQDVAEKLGNINSDIVSNALAERTKRIISPAYMTPGMGDGGGCHPRDNIALRFLAEKLNLGYDLFEAVMTSREAQAHNMAKKLIELSNKDLTFAIGFTKANMLIPFKINGRNVRLPNDLRFNCNLTIRDTRTLQRKLDAETIVTQGFYNFQFRPQISYAISVKLSVTAYFDKMFNNPLVSNSFYRSTVAGGFQLRYSLNE